MPPNNNPNPLIAVDKIIALIDILINAEMELDLVAKDVPLILARLIYSVVVVAIVLHIVLSAEGVIALFVARELIG